MPIRAETLSRPIQRGQWRYIRNVRRSVGWLRTEIENIQRPSS
jgi:hypothetical protein